VSLRLSAIPGLRVHASQANFYLAEMARARETAARLRERSIFVKEFDDSTKALSSHHLRITVKDREQNARIAEALEQPL
jgi:histidinol-phosphate/aromatic aminotransferase/cobyric acid decarboxylase-like protein